MGVRVSDHALTRYLERVERDVLRHEARQTIVDDIGPVLRGWDKWIGTTLHIPSPARGASVTYVVNIAKGGPTIVTITQGQRQAHALGLTAYRLNGA